MLSYIAQTTMAYLESMPKKDRKKIGQFFTSKETAEYMASLFAIPAKERISILDPGTGTGILSAALVEQVLKKNSLTSIELTCYEIDENVLPVLRDNLQVPPIEIISQIGKKLMDNGNLDTKNCDKIVMELAYTDMPEHMIHMNGDRFMGSR